MRTNLKCRDKTFVEADLKMKDEKDEERGNIKGFIDIKKLVYDFKIKAKDINLADESGHLSGSAEGYIKGEKSNLEGEFLLNNFGVGISEQKIDVSDILGVVTLNKNGNLSVIFQGEIGKIKYDKAEINGFKISADFGESLEIINASNKFLTLSGNYSIINSKIKLFAKGQDINKEVINISDLNYNISEINGNISGKLNDLNGKFTIKDGSIDLGEERYILFGGDINYSGIKKFLQKIL